MNGVGKLYFKYGTMGSAKTALLLTQAYNFEERGLKYLCMKPIIDNREKENVIRSRIGIERECSWIYPEMNIYEYVSELYDSSLVVKDWILIDESQFLTEEQVDLLAEIVDKYDLPVICYGIRTDFTSHLFSGSKRLMEIANYIEEVPTVCWCGRRAHFNARVSNGKIVRSGEQIMMGGNESYVSLCRRHFLSGEVDGAREREI